MPDVIYPVPRGGYHGMFLELKSLGKRAKVSDDQWEMLTKLARLGHYTCVCHGHREAIDAINRYEGII
jgi:hypothetical protein